MHFIFSHVWRKFKQPNLYLTMTKAEFLEICGQHWEDLQNLHRHDNLYDFEKDFEQLARELARKSFEGVLL